MRFYNLIGLLLILVSGAAYAQDEGRCDCAPENLGGSCYATVSLKGHWLTVTSNVPQCSRVDWYSDEKPQLTLVKNYKEVEEWLGPNMQPELSVESCRVCKNNDAGEQANELGSSSGDCRIRFSPHPGTPGWYTGQCENDIPNGKGQFESDGGHVITGTFQNGELNGHGSVRFPSGKYYEGDFRGGEYHGMGKSTSPDGMSYVGEFRNGTINGAGTLTFANGSQIKAHFENRGASGKGVQTFPNGDRFEGEFRKMVPYKGTLYQADGVKNVGTHSFENGGTKLSDGYIELLDGTKCEVRKGVIISGNCKWK